MNKLEKLKEGSQLWYYDTRENRLLRLQLTTTRTNFIISNPNDYHQWTLFRVHHSEEDILKKFARTPTKAYEIAKDNLLFTIQKSYDSLSKLEKTMKPKSKPKNGTPKNNKRSSPRKASTRNRRNIRPTN